MRVSKYPAYTETACGETWGSCPFGRRHRCMMTAAHKRHVCMCGRHPSTPEEDAARELVAAHLRDSADEFRRDVDGLRADGDSGWRLYAAVAEQLAALAEKVATR